MTIARTRGLGLRPQAQASKATAQAVLWNTASCCDDLRADQLCTKNTGFAPPNLGASVLASDASQTKWTEGEIVPATAPQPPSEAAAKYTSTTSYGDFTFCGRAINVEKQLSTYSRLTVELYPIDFILSVDYSPKLRIQSLELDGNLKFRVVYISTWSRRV
ncbi:hypothetical protein FB451DRAFT_1164949 [Mycena latifolia]|nr:hypothetical protein FB451DRAFT_1164949 [Mycena latifolia]